MNNAPLVSVLMTSYNREKYISQAIESVLNSSFENFELIVVDDVSKDNTVEIARSYERLDKRVKVYINEKNLGDYPNRNKAASYSVGRYLKYLDADDMLYKYSLEYFVEALEESPESALAISNSIIDDFSPYPVICSSKETYHYEYLGKSILGSGPSGAIIRASAFNKVGGFSESKYISDHELWLKLASIFSVMKLQPSLVWWRQHPDQQIVHERKDISIIDIRYKLSHRYLDLNRSFFNEDEFQRAKEKLIQNYSRLLLRKLIKEYDLTSFISLYKKSGLRLNEITKGFLPYK